MPVITRSFCYRAYPSPDDQAWLLEAMQRMKRAHRVLVDVEGSIADGLRSTIGDLWWPNRELVREWVRMSKLTRKKPGICGPGGALAGISQVKAEDAWTALHSSKQVSVTPIDSRDYRLTMLVEGNKSTTIRFRRHRPFPKNSHLIRWLLVAKPREGGKFNWSLQFWLKYEVPESQPAGEVSRVGGIDLGWRRVQDGFRVATLVVDGSATFYVLPWHDLYTQPKSSLTPSEIRKLENWRHDHLRKIAADIVRRCDEVRMERLGLRKLRDSGAPKEARRFVSPSLLVRCIEEAAESGGKRLVYVRAHRTSTDCSICGVGKMVRSAHLIWRCQHCGAEIDQDQNAGANIARKESLTVEEKRLPWKRKKVVSE